MKTVDWKFVGFLYTLLAVVLLVGYGPTTKYTDMAIGGLIAVVTAMGRDLYRSRTSEDDKKS